MSRSGVTAANFRFPPNPLQAPATPALPSPSTAETQAPATASAPMAVVLDPAHGGTDNGAHGAINEKDLVLAMSREIRNELVRQGYRVVMTRDSDSEPSYDDRASMANATPGAIYIALHVGSTGPANTARVYYERLSTPFTLPPLSTSGAGSAGLAVTPPASQAQPAPETSLTPWREAQRPFDATSQRLANLLQGILSAQFSGSPTNASAAAVRDLRSVAGPAIAIEISNIAVANPGKIGAMAPQLASAIGQTLAAFRGSAAPATATGAPR